MEATHVHYSVACIPLGIYLPICACEISFLYEINVHTGDKFVCVDEILLNWVISVKTTKLEVESIMVDQVQVPGHVTASHFPFFVTGTRPTEYHWSRVDCLEQDITRNSVLSRLSKFIMIICD